MSRRHCHTKKFVFDVITDHIELEDIVDKGFEALINDKSQAKILVKLSGEK